MGTELPIYCQQIYVTRRLYKLDKHHIVSAEEKEPSAEDPLITGET